MLSGVIWRWLFAPAGFLDDPSLVLPALAVVGAWKGFGFAMLALHAGIGNVPDHKAVPLYTEGTLAPGCDRIHASVRAEHVAGKAGAVQGQANGLTDETGGTGSGTHDSVMTHVFAVPS